MSEQDSNEKTEEATPEKRRKAREEGQFPRARDTGAMAASLAVLLGLAVFGEEWAGTVREFSVRCFRDPYTLTKDGLATLAQETFTTLLVVCAPVSLFAAAAAIAAGFAEAGIQPRFELLALKWERLDPISKLGQLFSPRNGAINTLLAMGRVGVVAFVTYKVLEDAFPSLSRLARAPLSTATHEILDTCLRLSFWALFALATLSALDYAQSWFKHEKQIMMSRQELKDEMHQQEGDPQVRARQRARAREMLKRGLVKQIKQSDVVIANPTHVSAAIRYRAAEGTPILTAKGYDDVALYIRKLAEENGIPIVENVPLARALAERVRPGKPIPVELFAAVAEVLAFVYRLRHRGVRA